MHIYIYIYIYIYDTYTRVSSFKVSRAWPTQITSPTTTAKPCAVATWVNWVTDNAPSAPMAIVSRCVCFPYSWPMLKRNCLHFSMCTCHPCAGTMLIFPVLFQF